MKTCMIAAVALSALLCQAATPRGSANIYESSAASTPANQIDRLVFAKLSSVGIKPVLCSDAVFVRRAYLDVIGTLPTAKEARAFIRDRDTKGKRRALIDRLLERQEFPDYWSMKWGDILRIKAEFPVNLWPNAAQAYHRWLRASIASNKPYDKFVREMLTSSGSNFRVGAVNFYRAVQSKTPESIAAAVALTFMGSRTDTWPKGRLEGVAVFFSQVGYKPTSEWKEECVFWDPLNSTAVPGNAAPGHAAPTTAGQKAGKAPQTQPATPARRGALKAAFPDGTRIVLPPNRDPREVFADWLIHPKNPWFSRCIVNRVWAWLLGRGIIHEPDDIRNDNPPSNPRLLAYLEKDFVAGGYDMKRLYRLILTSRTYQFSSVPRHKGPQAKSNFASYPLRRLDAEVLIDAVNGITGTSDLYTSAIPEPFTYIPRDQPAVAVADGSISSPFLTLFGRSARATGMANERDNKIAPSQWLHMLNSGHIRQKIERGPKLKAIYAVRAAPGKILEVLYLTILSRFPTAEEVKVVMAYGKSTKYKSRQEWIDIAWALFNSPEFLYRH